MKVSVTVLFMLLTLFSTVVADEVTRLQEDVNETVESLSRLLKGMNKNRNISEEDKARIKQMINELLDADVDRETEAIIEEIKDRNFGEAKDKAKVLFDCFKKLKSFVSKLEDPEKSEMADSLQDVLEQQRQLRKEMEDLKNKNANPLSEFVSEKMEKITSQLSQQKKIDKNIQDLNKMIGDKSPEGLQKLKDFSDATNFKEAQKKAEKLLDRLQQEREKWEKDNKAIADDLNKMSEEVKSDSSKKNDFQNKTFDEKLKKQLSDFLEKQIEKLNNNKVKEVAKDLGTKAEELKENNANNPKQGEQNTQQAKASKKMDKAAKHAEQNEPEKAAELLKELKKSINSETQEGGKKEQLKKTSQEVEKEQLEQALETLKKLQKQLNREQKESFTQEEKKTIEHLKTKQKELAAQMQKMLDNDSMSDLDSKKKMQVRVDQMSRIANMVQKGELDSGIWESLQLEKELEELIKKMSFDQNRYAMQQRLQGVSDFVEFVRELKSRQEILHEDWVRYRKGKLTEERLSMSLDVQKKIEEFSHSRDQVLKDSESLSYIFGLTKVQKVLAGFVKTLGSKALPLADDCFELEQLIQALEDGLKSLKGRLQQVNKRPKKRESHDGGDVAASQGVSVIEELKYLRMLQKIVHQNRLKSSDSLKLKEEQRRLLDLFLKLQSKYKEHVAKKGES